MHFSAFRLQQAIRNREFTPFYQPIVCATGGEVVGCEMLARWLHPQKGLLSAGNFIPAIEATGLGGALLRGLADEVCGDGQDLARSAGRRLMMTLNLSLSLVMTPLFRPHLLALSIRLEQAGMTPVFEITEREDIRAFPQAAVFRQVAAGGLRFAVAQAARLRDAGGDYLQGWHCGAPMPFGLFHFRLTQKSQPAFG
ncbi:EAL domain-containing protein [Salmonella enterica]|uniref:EAL domain-containing protein n=1 Tax=Salmonella enterica TaxID=28901 RepID=UPI00083CB606|nr:EAL domain-containing protein [Salmonella enterica]ODH91522.1 hypothetical protein AIJ63_22820 [Salmonella enterica subsp. enterica serovar Enteritidis]